MLDILPGRSLVLATSWETDGAQVVFDRNSGDYWIVSSLAHEVIRLLVTEGPEDVAALPRHLAEKCPHAADTQAALVRVIRELVQREILTDA